MTVKETAAELRSRLRVAYDLKAHERDGLTLQAWKRQERELFLSLLCREGKQSFLEIGTGPEADSQFFQENGLTVVGIDLSPQMVRLCQEKGVTALVMDAAQLEFPGESFDAVYAFNSLLHLPKVEIPHVLQEIRRVLQAGGFCYIGVYGGDDREEIWEDDPYRPKRFFSFYSDEQLQKAVAGLFETVSFRTIAVDGSDPRIHFQTLNLRKL